MRWYLLALLLVEAQANRILSKGRYIERREGDSVYLSCDVENLESDIAVLWKKDDDPIFIDEVQVGNSDSRRKVLRYKNNSTLSIEQLERFDTADYNCTVAWTPEVSITYHLEVTAVPTITLTPNVKQYNVNTGEDVNMECSANGNPEPQISWSRTGLRMPLNSLVKQGTLRISKVTAADAGQYMCIATNKVATAKEAIELVVRDGASRQHEEMAPWVETDYAYLPVELDKAVNISCKYDGQPHPDVRWYFNSFIINEAFDEKFKKLNRYAVRHTNYTETILEINSVNEDHFGDYMCSVSNSLGEKQAKVHVSGRPGPPKLELSERTLSWEIESASPIIEYKIKYRTSKDDDWQKTIEIRPEKGDQDGNWWKRSYVLPAKLFLPGDTYELQVQARNALGWGSLAPTYKSLDMTKEAKKTDEPSFTTGQTAYLQPIFVLVLSYFFSRVNLY